MSRLSIKNRILFTSSLIPGILAGILEFYPLVFLSLLLLYVSLNTSPEYRHHELTFLFPLSVAACLPVNIIAAVNQAMCYSDLFHSSLQILPILFFLLALVSAEELIFSLIGLILWGKQEALFWIDQTQKEVKTEGVCLHEITEEEMPCYPITAGR